MDTPRIPPLEAPFPPEVDAELARWMPPGAAVPPLALFRTLAVHLPLAQAMRALGSHLLGRRLSLSLREREIVIARVCVRSGCEYEWGVHVAAFGAAAGLGEEEVAATVAPPGAVTAFSGREALLVELVDALHDRGAVHDDLWARLAAHHDERQLLELLVLCGWYRLISLVANGARVPLEAWARRFPDRAPVAR